MLLLLLFYYFIILLHYYFYYFIIFFGDAEAAGNRKSGSIDWRQERVDGKKILHSIIPSICLLGARKPTESVFKSELPLYFSRASVKPRSAISGVNEWKWEEEADEMFH